MNDGSEVVTIIRIGMETQYKVYPTVDSVYEEDGENRNSEGKGNEQL